ncbi:MAG: hypothetical protein OXG35_15240, partial [Acidobacteria bacterium]|nr:hypothetical protein [Acidobacteriota bacterium]
MERGSSPAQVDLLEQLAETPLADRIELAALSGCSTATVYRGIERLSARGLVEGLAHAAELLPATRRFQLSAAGVRHLAEERGTSPATLLAECPVSEEWRRSLLRRLDGVAAIYRLASALAEVRYPIRLRWYRSAAPDASVALPDGRTLALLRLGRGLERTAAAFRVRRLGEGPQYSAALILAPDETRLLQLRRLARGLPFGGFLALERYLLIASADDAVWVPRAGGPALSLGEVLGFVHAGGEWARERTPQRRTPPRPMTEGAERDRMLPSLLGPAQKRTIDLIADWPWLAPQELAKLLGVGRRRVSQLTGSLADLELIAAPRVERRSRLVLTDRALRLLAQRDRARPAEARRRWSAGPITEGEETGWRGVAGRRSRQLVRHIGHTEAVHQFAAELSSDA